MNTILAVTYAFMLGFMPCDWTGTPDNRIIHKNATHVKYEIGLDLFDCVHLYTGEDTKQTPVTLFNWYPYTQKYYVGAEYHKTFNEAFTLKAGVRHECNHPVSCWGAQTDKYNDSATEFYIGFYGKVDIWRKK